jgi:NAD-dependent SIR2 family protein deacetylase
MEGVEPRGRSIECIDCHRVFYLTAEEERWRNMNQLTLPVRCPKCRKARRQKHTIDIDSEKVKARDKSFDEAMARARQVIQKYQ